MKPTDPAFPYAFEHQEPPQSGFAPGMSVRAYFAAKAMQGLVAGEMGFADADVIASHAVIQAEALIAELNKPKEGEAK